MVKSRLRLGEDNSFSETSISFTLHPSLFTLKVSKLGTCELIWNSYQHFSVKMCYNIKPIINGRAFGGNPFTDDRKCFTNYFIKL